MQNKLSKQELESILNMLNMKKEILKSCVKDYEVQVSQVEAMIKSFEPSATVVKESAESQKK